MHKKILFTSLFTLSFLFTNNTIKAQFLMDMVDTTKSMGQDMLGLYKRLNGVRMVGYIQPQFQVAQAKGAKNYAGGDFNPFAASRFMMRRARIRTDYVTFSPQKTPKTQMVFQVDATERGVNVRDVWGRFFENKYDCFALTLGLFARPMGFEVNYSSGDREAPERGRMSQILMRTERDMGAMLTFSPQKKTSKFKSLQMDLGIFNGQGLAGPAEVDSYKDIIGRIQYKRYPLSKNVFLTVSASYLNGGIRQNNKNSYFLPEKATDYVLTSDSLMIGSRSPRKYLGADAQLKIENHFGNTEFRAEIIQGTQTATASTSETPGTAVSDPLYVRHFNGAYFCVLQNFTKKHQFVLKYDWYDPNAHISGTDLKANTKLSAADVKFNTLGLGYVFYMNDNLKWVLWYDVVRNEKTQIAGFTEDVKDNIFTFRAQYRF